MLYYILFIVLLTAVSLVGLLLMVKKYYWGPTGRPPQYRPHGGKLREEITATTKDTELRKDTQPREEHTRK